MEHAPIPVQDEQASPHPLRMFMTVLVLVFLVEAGIMLTMRHWTWPLEDPYVLAATDALLLTVVLSPMLWFVIVRPMRHVSEYRAYLLTRVHGARVEERARLALDLHDDVGQRLTAVLVGLRTLEQAPDAGAARERAGAVREMAAGAMETVRRLARGLRSTDLADLGLVPMVERLCEESLSLGGVRAEVESDIPPGVRPTPAVEEEVYRIIQEATTNILRHAGATRAGVRLRLRGGTLTVEVSDNGRGMGETSGGSGGVRGVGLSGMRDRVKLLDGRMEIASTPGGGTTIRVTVPRVLTTYEPDTNSHR
ncbi:MAG: sensor histidine kinase [Phycisphaerales bacterium]